MLVSKKLVSKYVFTALIFVLKLPTIPSLQSYSVQTVELTAVVRSLISQRTGLLASLGWLLIA